MIRRTLFLQLLALVLAAGPLLAQRDTTQLPAGVRLGLTYQAGVRQKLAVQSFRAEPALVSVATLAHDIVQRDLDYSDRFQMVQVPAGLAQAEPTAGAWNDLGVVFLVRGEFRQGAGGAELQVTLYDVAYNQMKQQRSFALPAASSPGFRMAVHVISDEIVRWITNEPGIAATRIAAIRRTSSGHDLLLVDSDGAGLIRIAGGENVLLSPVWAPDGRKLAYARGGRGGWRVLERDMASGDERLVSEHTGLNYTPAYSPDGKRMAFAVSAGPGTELYDYDISRSCCRRRLTSARGADLSPTYSPDGSQIAFNSDRLGQPHIYVMPAEGGPAVLVSPYAYPARGYYTSPDWSPRGSLIAFHGRSRGNMQLMLADATRPGATVQQLTIDGESEDPSWAPDGRHLVFSGVRGGVAGLYVIDTASGRVRPLLTDTKYLVPDWSPPLTAGRP